MAYFWLAGGNAPNYITLITDRDKIRASATETLEEYLTINRFGMVPDRITLYDPIQRSISEGYQANVKCLYYNLESKVKIKKIVTKEMLYKYDVLATAGLEVPVVKKHVAEFLQQYCGDKIQVIDVLITLKSGEEIHDYKAINVINRVEAFTWDGSIKGGRYDECISEFKKYLEEGLNWMPEEMKKHHEQRLRTRFEKYGCPYSFLAMNLTAFKNDVIEQSVICKDSVTETNLIMVSTDLAKALKKLRLKGLGLFGGDEVRGYRIV